MIIIDEEYRKLIEMRIQQDAAIFFVDLTIKSSVCGWNVINRKKLMGISTEGVVVLPAIYDDVVILSRKTAALNINGKYALYDLIEHVFITHFMFIRIEKDGEYFILRRERGDFSLYDVYNDRILLKNGGYDQMNTQQTNTEYIWVRRGKYYDFIERRTGRLISMPGLIMAYDTKVGMFGYGQSHMVKCYRETGAEDMEAFRTEVISSGGYLLLNNFAQRVTDVSDVYGNIVNI